MLSTPVCAGRRLARCERRAPNRSRSGTACAWRTQRWGCCDLYCRQRSRAFMHLTTSLRVQACKDRLRSAKTGRALNEQICPKLDDRASLLHPAMQQMPLLLLLSNLTSALQHHERLTCAVSTAIEAGRTDGGDEHAQERSCLSSLSRPSCPSQYVSPNQQIDLCVYVC